MSSPESAIAAAQSRVSAVEYLDQVERVTAELAGGCPKTTSEDLAALKTALSSLSSFAWALKNFPVFDPSCLEQQHKAMVTAKINSGLAVIEIEATVPVFARDKWSTLGPIVHRSIDFHALSEKNQREIAGRLQGGGYYHVGLSAQCPKPPKSVRELVAGVEHRFDRIDLAWEAEWQADVRVRDPLVIGVIGRTEFLIAEWDASKLERYIASEFTKSKPS